jgi:pyridoxal phosphate enzyme (YggS family)
MNLKAVQQRIYDAASHAGRDPQTVRLVVVSKAQPVDVVRAAYLAGVREFGENYPQEAEEKILQVADLANVTWHMIGHLQSRKSAIIARHFQMIHSIDSLNLADKLNRVLAEQQKTLQVLLEVNVGGEESKFGWRGSNETEWRKLLADFRKVSALPNLRVAGLMTMPPLFDPPELARPYFKMLRQLAEFLHAELPETTWTELSMGTSSDFEAAIAEGATIVRVGQAILGARPAKNTEAIGEVQ